MLRNVLRAAAALALGIAIGGCSSTVEILVENEMDTDQRIELRGERFEAWLVPAGEERRISSRAEPRSLLLILSTECQVEDRYGVSAGSYVLTIRPDGAHLVEGSIDSSATSAEAIELCDT
jgi:hypothetical protein